MTPKDHVLAFIAAWNANDIERIVSLMTPDVFYHNIPRDPLVGHDQVRAFFAAMPPFRGVDWVMHAIAADGPVVLTERTDRFLLPNGHWAEIRVSGTFEVAPDGRIAKWRDYYDEAEVTREFGKLALPAT
jgi:limonene-1,2-epoxide hydrolase